MKWHLYRGTPGRVLCGLSNRRVYFSAPSTLDEEFGALTCKTCQRIARRLNARPIPKKGER